MNLLHYRIYSTSGTISHEKPVLVFLHGLAAHSSVWLPQIKKLKPHFDLLLIDLPSHGKTQIKLSTVEPTFDVVSKMIIDVLDHLKISKAVFVGSSLGTLFIKHLVLNYRERVEKYILIGAVGKFEFWYMPTLKTIRTLLPVLSIRMVCKIVIRAIIPSRRHDVSRKFFLATSKKLTKKEIVSWIDLIMTFPEVNEEYEKQMSSFHNGMYISGDVDLLFLDTIKAELKLAAKKVILKGCGHICNIDKPDEVNDLIISFVQNSSYN